MCWVCGGNRPDAVHAPQAKAPVQWEILWTHPAGLQPEAATAGRSVESVSSLGVWPRPGRGRVARVTARATAAYHIRMRVDSSAQRARERARDTRRRARPRCSARRCRGSFGRERAALLGSGGPALSCHEGMQRSRRHRPPSPTCERGAEPGELRRFQRLDTVQVRVRTCPSGAADSIPPVSSCSGDQLPVGKGTERTGHVSSERGHHILDTPTIVATGCCRWPCQVHSRQRYALANLVSQHLMLSLSLCLLSAAAEDDATSPTSAPPSKVASARSKLKEVRDTIPLLEKELRDTRLSVPQIQEVEEACAHLERFRQEIGLEEAVSTLKVMERALGQTLAKAGGSFEEASEGIVVHHILPKLRSHTAGCRTFLEVGSTPCVTSEQSLPISTRHCEELVVLRNVTLGMAAGEMDYVVVKCLDAGKLGKFKEELVLILYPVPTTGTVPAQLTLSTWTKP
eukprot:scaffold1628_cov407-Prasinococcus_capsulatus_cf.AAC.12